jgi:hypothetical protein
MDENSGLSNAGLFQFIGGASEHDVGDSEAQDAVGLFEERFGFGIAFVKVFAHTGELGALAGEDVGFHQYGFLSISTAEM